jgi:hypothetical protein
LAGVAVNQIAMFQEAAPAVAQPPSERRPTQVLAEDLWYDDGPGCSVAKYMATVQHPRWEWCTSGLWVTVERHFGTKPHRWMAEVHLELPDDGRTYWSARAIFEKQDDAAQEAADMAAVAIDLLRRHLRGEAVETPGERLRLAAEAYADASPQWQHMQSMADAERAVRDSIDPDSGEKFYAHRRYLAAKDAADSTRRSVLDEFYRAHSWREFAEVPHVA